MTTDEQTSHTIKVRHHLARITGKDPREIGVFVHPARETVTAVLPHDVDGIATEPAMGPSDDRVYCAPLAHVLAQIEAASRPVLC